MAFTPWTEQSKGAKFGEEPSVDEEKRKWWELWKADERTQTQLGQAYEQEQGRPGWQQFLLGPSITQEPGGGAYSPLLRGVPPTVGIPGTGGVGLAGGMLGGPTAAQSAANQLWKVPQWMGQHKLLAGAGALATYAGFENLRYQATPPGMTSGPDETWPSRGVAPPGMVQSGAPPMLQEDGTPITPTEETVTLPKPGDDITGVGGQPLFFTDESGIRWVYNDYTGQWTQVQAPAVRGLTAEQEIAQAQMEREHQQALLRQQYELERGAMTQQSEAERGTQQAGAAQQMAQMYAADPYKYWAQMGMGTPGAVARLTGGEIGPGEPFQQGVPLSMPSQQWWGNLLPSEQQQISGGLNWLGVDPQDWYSMKQRMIPGLEQRQISPQWAR